MVNGVKFLPACVLSRFSHVRVRVRLFETLWTVVPQASPSMGFSGQEYWSGLPFPSGDLPNPGTEPWAFKSPTLASGASLMAQTVKRLPAMRETPVLFLGQENPLEKEMGIHFSTLAWKIPWTDRL